MAFKIIRNDIKKVSADAVVRVSKPEESAVGTGQAVYEEAFGSNAKYLIRTACPARTDRQKQALQSCYDGCLGLAKKLGCGSIAFPLIAAGEDGLSNTKELQIAVDSFREFLADSDMEIILAVPDDVSLSLSEGIFSGIDAYIDEHYVSGLGDFGSSIEIVNDEEALTEPTKEKKKKPGRGLFQGSPFSLRRKEAAGCDEAADEPAMPAAIPGKARNMPAAAAGEAGAMPAAIGGKESAMAMVPKASAMPAAMSMAMGAAASKTNRSLEDIMAHVGETWQESLFRLIDEKGFTDTEVYKRANVDRKLFSKIRSNSAYQPKKITAVAFALALCLSLDETKDLLSRAGYALSKSSRFDLIIEYFIENEVYDTYTINLALFEHDQPLLGE